MLILISLIGFGILGYELGKTKKMGPTSAAILSLLLGLIGIVVVLCSKNAEKLTEE